VVLIFTYQRIVLLDCDMVVLRNMDELMTIDLPNDHIAAVHVCACNPRGIEHYPNDWSVIFVSFRISEF
jgi:alpha-N-acetylglucosamine transferase